MGRVGLNPRETGPKGDRTAESDGIARIAKVTECVKVTILVFLPDSVFLKGGTQAKGSLHFLLRIAQKRHFRHFVRNRSFLGIVTFAHFLVIPGLPGSP